MDIKGMALVLNSGILGNESSMKPQLFGKVPKKVNMCSLLYFCMGERIEALLRIPLGIFYGLVLYALGIIASILWIFLFLYTLILGKRHRGAAEFMNGCVSLMYRIYRYMSFATNERPRLNLQPIEPLDF